MIKLDVIGDPIEHSKSPIVHGMVLDNLNIDYEYNRVLVKKGELEAYVKQAIQNGIVGFNLTMPHKVDILPYLKDIDDDAILFGAVNTVKIKDGNLYGYNTDAGGFAVSLNENGFTPKDKEVVILGAGGVSATLAVKLAVLGAKKIVVLNRTVDKAKKICDVIENLKKTEKYSEVKTETKFDNFDNNTISAYVRTCDLLINATPLGMTGVKGDYEELSFVKSLKKTALVADLIYSPERTKFLISAENNGNKIMNGFGMLVAQAILADEIYLNQKIDVSELFTKLVK